MRADNRNMFAAVGLIVIASSIWVGFDARSRDWSDNSFADEPWKWVVGSLLLWIVIFPMYLVKRSQTAPAVMENTQQQMGSDVKPPPGWTAEQMVGRTVLGASSSGSVFPSQAESSSRSFRLEGGTSVPTWLWLTLLIVVVLGFVWNTGALDHTLYHVGLQRHDCFQNGFGAVFCGDEATEYQNRLRDAGLAP